MSLTSEAKIRSEPQPAAHSLCSATKGQGLAAAALSPQATLLRTRPGQTLTLAYDQNETAFIVGSGTLALHVTLPNTSRQVVSLLFQGDAFRSSVVPPHAEAALVSAAKGEIWRLRMSALNATSGDDTGLARSLDEALINQMARRALHAVMLGQFDGEQKVATFLVELALRTGTLLPGGVALDVPFARQDIAGYLGLNPDTLSRIMSRLRSRGIFWRVARSQIMLNDFHALAVLSPASQALAELHRERTSLPCCATCKTPCKSL